MTCDQEKSREPRCLSPDPIRNHKQILRKFLIYHGKEIIFTFYPILKDTQRAVGFINRLHRRVEISVADNPSVSFRP